MLGGTIARRLLANREKVRVLARPQSNYRPLKEGGAEVLFGDLKDRPSLDPACGGAEILITTANSAKRGGDDNPRTVDLEGNRNLIDAGKKAGLKHFIFVSPMAADANSPVPFLQAKGRSEQYLQASGLPHTIIAPDFYMEDWLGMVVVAPAMSGQPVTVVGGGNRKHSFISTADVASFVLACIRNPAAINRRLVIGGPEALSFRDAATIFGRAMGRELPVISVQPGEAIPGVPEAVLPLLAALDTYDSKVDMADLSRTFKVELTSPEAFARRAMPS